MEKNFFAQTYSQPFRSLNNITSSPGFLGQWLNNLQRAALLTSSVDYDKILCKIWSTAAGYACGLNQTETEKYFQ